jgi:hypothetical protein
LQKPAVLDGEKGRLIMVNWMMKDAYVHYQLGGTEENNGKLPSEYPFPSH